MLFVIVSENASHASRSLEKRSAMRDGPVGFMKYRYATFPVILLAVTLGCKYLSREPAVASEAADKNPVATVKTSAVALNNEPAGSLDNTAPLHTKLSEIQRYRSTNGVYEEGSAEVHMWIYLLADTTISIGKLGGLIVNKTYFPRGLPVPSTNGPVKPDPLMLVVKTENAPSEWFPGFRLTKDELERIACETSFTLLDSPGTLAGARIENDSIEISSDDRYFINTKVQTTFVEGTRDLKEKKVDQRPANEDDLKGEISRLIDLSRGIRELRIIANENASYASLLKILASIDRPGVKAWVSVRPMEFPPPRRR